MEEKKTKGYLITIGLDRFLAKGDYLDEEPESIIDNINFRMCYP